VHQILRSHEARRDRGHDAFLSGKQKPELVQCLSFLSLRVNTFSPVAVVRENYVEIELGKKRLPVQSYLSQSLGDIGSMDQQYLPDDEIENFAEAYVIMNYPLWKGTRVSSCFTYSFLDSPLFLLS